jgi:hypothetical protein
MDWTRFELMTALDLWHCQLGHTPNKLIKLKIDHSTGLEKLNHLPQWKEIQPASEMSAMHDWKISAK